MIDHDKVSAAIAAVIAESDEMVPTWIFAYETSGIDEAGDFGSGWGSCADGSNMAKAGLAQMYLTAHTEDMRTDD